MPITKNYIMIKPSHVGHIFCGFMGIHLRQKILKIIYLLLLLIGCGVASATPLSEPESIRQLLNRQFDKLGQPLSVEHVVVDKNYAIASWVQADTGGRALLKRDAHKWQIVLCGGDGLKHVDVLRKSGMPEITAKALSKKITAAELHSPSELRRKFSLFKGEISPNHPM